MPNRFTLPRLRRLKPRWLVLSVAAHLLLAFGLVKSYGGWRAAVPTRTLSFLLDVPPAVRERPIPPPPAAAPPPAAGRPRRPLELPLTPEARPSDVATLPLRPDTLPAGGGGARGLRAGPVLTPRYGDARVWSAQAMYIPEGGGRPIAMDSVVRQRLLMMAGMMDSIARYDTLSLAADRRARNPDWTVERNGRRYGIDERGIHFGTFSLPTAILAFLPIPQGNIDQARANQRLLELRAEILRAAARAEAEDDFQKAVQGIRERWRKEREERRERDRQLPSGERPRP